MTASVLCRPQLTARRPRTALVLLIETAARGDLTHAKAWPWPVFLVNGRSRPDARLAIAGLIRDGFLAVTDSTLDLSEVRPTTAGLARIGATR